MVISKASQVQHLHKGSDSVPAALLLRGSRAERGTGRSRTVPLIGDGLSTTTLLRDDMDHVVAGNW